MKIIKRDLYDDLIKWNKNKGRRPLLLSGVRKIGKTHLIKTFADNIYPNKYVYINLLENTKIKNMIEDGKDVKDIVQLISLHFSKGMQKGWLIIFDEIQELPNLIIALNLLNENCNEYPIIGSGNSLNDFST